MAETVMRPDAVARIYGACEEVTARFAEEGATDIVLTIGRLGLIRTGEMISSVAVWPSPENARTLRVGIRGPKQGDWMEHGTRERREDDAFPVAAPDIRKVTPGNRGVRAHHMVRDAAYRPRG